MNVQDAQKMLKDYIDAQPEYFFRKLPKFGLPTPTVSVDEFWDESRPLSYTARGNNGDYIKIAPQLLDDLDVLKAALVLEANVYNHFLNESARLDTTSIQLRRNPAQIRAGRSWWRNVALSAIAAVFGFDNENIDREDVIKSFEALKAEAMLPIADTISSAVDSLDLLSPLVYVLQHDVRVSNDFLASFLNEKVYNMFAKTLHDFQVKGQKLQEYSNCVEILQSDSRAMEELQALSERYYEVLPQITFVGESLQERKMINVNQFRGMPVAQWPYDAAGVIDKMNTLIKDYNHKIPAMAQAIANSQQMLQAKDTGQGMS